MAEIKIRKVENDSDKNQFINLPWKIYKDYPNWVPPLKFDVKNNLNPNKNPFFNHAKVELYLAEVEGRLVGRIAAIVNDNHNNFYKDKVGFFGFFECINDTRVSRALFDKAYEFLKSHGMDTMRGPVNPSTNDECGLLVDSFNSPPVMLMTYNPEYYIKLFEDYGLAKAKDLLALYIPKEVINNTKKMEQLERISNMVMKRENIKIRNVDLKDFDNEVQRVREVYNNAWQDNWGFVPMTEDEFKYIAKTLKAVVDKDFVVFAEVEGKTIGFSLALPDFNQVLKHLNGSLFPFGLFKLLYYKNKIDLLRVIIMGVNKEYHKKGIDAVFYQDVIKAGNRKGYKGAEISWVLEDNLAMKQTAEKLGAHVYKTYRIYDKSIS
ncbi:MAG: N-acetyltransferase [Ignavibacteria bacterium]|nr:N-acetyltransferase [Ignavibacteria bacterium]